MTDDNPATVTVVTGPDGHDIGPAVAHLGRNLGDGLAVRTGPRAEHASPVPDAGMVRLEVLPSAWQDPDTNLGVIRQPGQGGAFLWHDALRADLERLDRLGLHPGHRLTIERLDGLRHPAGELCEPGGLAVAARDSVLRGQGRRQVLLEAGDGQTLLDAMATFRLPPWSPHIQHLDLWLVFDVAQLAVTPDHGTVAQSTATLIAAEVARQGGGADSGGKRLLSLKLVLLNFPVLVPETAGMDTAAFRTHVADGGKLTDDAAERVGEVIIAVEGRAGAEIGWLGTGTGPGGVGQFVDIAI